MKFSKLRTVIRNPIARILSFLPLIIRKVLWVAFSDLKDIAYLSTYIRDSTVGLTVNGIDFRLRLKGGHRGAHYCYVGQQSTGQIYEEIMVGCLTQILKLEKDPSFIDVGSFMGYYACYVSSMLNDQFTVYAIESNKEFCQYIRHSVSENKFQNVKVLNEALSDIAADVYVWDRIVFSEKQDDKYIGSGFTSDQITHKRLKDHSYRSDSYKTSSITLDDLCTRHDIKPTILKIDVHGAEGKVLGGSKRCLQSSIRWVLLELDTEHLLSVSSSGYTRTNILRLLEQCQFDCYLVGAFRGDKLTPEREHFLKYRKPLCIPISSRDIPKIGFDRNNDELMILAISPKVTHSDRSTVFDILNTDNSISPQSGK